MRLNSSYIAVEKDFSSISLSFSIESKFQLCQALP